MRDFHSPRLWLGVWIFGWALCIVLSLVHPPQLGIDVPESDKIGHALAYAALSAWAVMLFRAPRGHWLAATSLVALGVAMELAQGAFTDDRMMDWRDGIADTLGVLLGQGLAWTPWQTTLQRVDRAFFQRT